MNKLVLTSSAACVIALSFDPTPQERESVLQGVLEKVGHRKPAAQGR
ncbi:MAG TPA: hypothetical protein VGP93_20965 [Polyangiaceae bacterium]|nr:hypothetical protein [Polyangiaceae bacterium]